MSTANFELVSFDRHQHLKVNNQSYNISENKVNAALVVAGELNTLCHEYPIFITQNADSKAYQLTALLGLHSGENLYLDGDKWRATYLPLDVLRKPFQAFIPDPKDATKGHIAIDLNSELVNETVGEPLFEQDGQASEFFKRIQSSFSQLMGGTQYTSDLLGEAASMGLLEPISLSVDLPNEQKANLNGLYTFDKKKVTELSGEALQQCHESGILQICHLLMSSGAHLQKLINWYSEKHLPQKNT